MVREHDRKIVLEDGSVYTGYGFGANCDKVNELVFNTSMVGYQEIISDPSYTYQMVVMTYPLIGNYGITDEDFETRTPTIGGLIVREYNDLPSNFRYTRTLSEVLEDNGIPGISDVDTRELTRKIRDYGSCKVLITDIGTPVEKALEILKNTDLPKDAVARVSCKKRWYSKTFKPKYNVVAVDCGIKRSIIRSLNKLGCNLTIVPWNTTAEVIEEMHPDGVFFSNGPGDPENVPETEALVRELRGKYPIFGICLGHQLICKSYGAKTYKLKFGHHGGNHPVENISTGKIEMTSQNHSYVVDMDSIKNTDLQVTHINLLDHTLEGVCCERDSIFSVQYHPESAPGPQDSTYLFDCFINLMEEWNHAKKN